MKKKKVRVEDAVGMVIMHDLTGVKPGLSSGAVFRKGHVIRISDIPRMKSIGKEHIWVLELAPGEIHEDAAAMKFAAFRRPGISVEGPSEGKILFKAEKDGLLEVDRRTVDRINAIGGIVFSTRHTDIPVRARESFAGIRIVPLALDRKKIEKAVRLAAQNPPFLLRPFKKMKLGLVVTGTEVASGRIKDGFRPVVSKKAADYGCVLSVSRTVPDDERAIVRAITEVSRRSDIVIVTGGMSVDPDDVTRAAIGKAGAKTVIYGVPAMPGNMTLIAYLGRVPVIGTPACALHRKTTVLDLVLPLALAGRRITAGELLKKGYGGFCIRCRECSWPVCAFGKC